MVSADTPFGNRASVLTPPAVMHSVIGIIACLLIALLVAFSLYRQTPPAAVGASAPAYEFSSERAMKHLQIIGQNPHPMGAIEHSKVRDYILQQLQTAGLTPEVLETTGLNLEDNPHIRAGTVQNIVAKLPGTANTRAVMLLCHYDSVSTGPGAADDGAAVASMLETLRALKSVAPLKNDVIFLFTDGEEAGHLGAQAFVAESLQVKDLGLVLNFEARGNSGPVILFETGERNGWLIKEFAKAAPYPVATSLAYEIYRFLPNDTDFTPFKSAQLTGLNFAYINGLTHYHTQLDNINEIDERSLQHEGSTALALARHFGDLNLNDVQATNAVYFDVVGLTLIHYSSRWVVPLSSIIVLACVVLIIIGLKKNRLTLSGIAWGFLAFLVGLIIAPVSGTLFWSLILNMREVPGFRPLGEVYNNNIYLLGFVAWTIAVVSALYIFMRKRKEISSTDLTVGALIWWLILLVLASVFLPGASYLLTWPLLFMLPALAYGLALKDRAENSVALQLLFAIASITAIILMVPLIYQIFIALTLNLIGVIIAMVVLLLSMLVPHLRIIAPGNRFRLPIAAALAGLALIVIAGFSSSYDNKHPRFNTILYKLNADTGNAAWASSDRRPDPWTKQFFSSDSLRAPLTDIFSKGSSRPFLQVAALPQPLSAPRIELLSDATQNGVRALHMRATSSREAIGLAIYLDSLAEVVESSVNGKRIVSPAGSSGTNRNQWDLRYYAVPKEGIEITMQLKTAEPIRLRVVDQTYGFPQALDKMLEARPASTIPAPFPYNDSTFVSKSFVF